MSLRRNAAAVLCLLGLGMPGSATAGTPAAAFTVGADLSFLPAEEAHGAVFRDSAGVGDAIEVLARHGVTSVRLRLWHTPAGGHSGLAEVLAMAARTHARGLGLLLDLHLSDTWADPAHQAPPAAWAGLADSAFADSLYRYTRDVVDALAAQGTPPDVVQIGNEITSGMLWDAGRVGGAFDTPAQWRRLAALLRAGARGVREAAPAARVMLHLDRGGDAAGCRWFFDRAVAYGAEFDAIGLSYYPWWHGPPDSLAATLADVASRYGRDVYVVETSYPWTLAALDATPNLVGLASQLAAGFDATPQGQAAFLARVGRIVAATPGGRGRGVFVWAPDWVAAPGLGSSGENLALFDAAGLLLPAADAMAGAGAALGVAPRNAPADRAIAWPDPFRDSVTIRFVRSRPGRGVAHVVDAAGRRVRTLGTFAHGAGGLSIGWDGRDAAGRRAPPGVYVVRFRTEAETLETRVTRVR